MMLPYARARKRPLQLVAAAVLLLCCGWGAPPIFAEPASPAELAGEVVSLYRQGKYQEAIPLAERLLALDQKRFGPENAETARALNDLGQLYAAAGDYTKAEPLLRQALDARRRLLGPQHFATGATLGTLAAVYYATGNYAQAEPLFQQGVHALERARGLESAPGGEDGDSAGPLLQEVLKDTLERDAVKGPDSAVALPDLAAVYETAGNFLQMEALLEQAVEILQQVRGPDHADTVAVLDDLATLYQAMGDCAKAEPRFRQVLEIQRKKFGPRHPAVATALTHLAGLFRTTGDYAQAEGLLRQVIEIREMALGPDHAETLQSIADLALLQQAKGDYAQAASLFDQVARRAQRTFGPQHGQTATALNQLAFACALNGDYARATDLFAQVLQIRRTALGSQDPATGVALNNLAASYRELGEDAKAEPLFQEALPIIEKTFGPAHSKTMTVVSDLAWLDLGLGKRSDAKALVERYATASQASLSRILAYASERQRLAYRNTVDPYSLLAALGGTDALLADAILHFKSVVLDSMIEDRQRAAHSPDPELVSKFMRERKQLGRLLLRMFSPPAAGNGQQIEDLQQDLGEVQAQLARQVAALGEITRAFNVTASQVEAVLPKTNALVEFVRFQQYAGNGRSEPRYGAVVFCPKTSARWVALGRAEAIDALVAGVQTLSARGSSDEKLAA
ncbi:MAG: tetratricopeptide repeat protein, partial [Verrucomicrobia bacterium]|nr:tetratricopeptide repeat protein [Verrucomicrobiota bacterium]